jgi:hypothetical protein
MLVTFGTTANNGVGEINGNHSVGDVLVLTDFTQGSPVTDFKVYQWVASGGSAAEHLDLVDPGTDCQVSLLTDACSTVNDTLEVSPWPFVPKANVGDPGEFEPGLFIEGGIDLTELIPDSDGCFSRLPRPAPVIGQR